MRLSCSARAFFSSSATSSIASFATYSTSCSLIFIRKENLLDPGRRPRRVQLRQQLRPHSHQLLSPDQVWHFDDHARSVHSCHAYGPRQVRPNQRWPEFLEHL